MQFEPDAAKIKRWREERHWSQEHLAELAGIGTRTVQRIETGESASKETVMALAAAFNVDVSAVTVDPEAVAREEEFKSVKKGLNALNFSFYIHMASYTFSMIVFLAISVSDNQEGLIMLIPGVWWTVVISAHALTVIIVTLTTQYESAQAE